MARGLCWPARCWPTRKPKPNWSGFVSDPSSPKYVESACNSTIDDQLVKVFFQEGCLQRLASDGEGVEPEPMSVEAMARVRP